MIITVQGARTALAIAVAGASVIAAMLLTPHSSEDRRARVSSIVSAKLTSRKILGGDQDIAVTITMLDGRPRARPPLSLAIVIDRSGSMEGEPLANAKAAAARLVDRLDERDAFSIITYSTDVETVVPIARAAG